MQKILFIVTILLTLISCSSKFKNKVGLHSTVPDEYQTKRYPSLEVPPPHILKYPAPESSRMPKDIDSSRN